MDSSRLNISNAQEDILYWHNTFGHYNIQRTQSLFKLVGDNIDPVIIPKLPAAKTYSVPICISCILYKGRLTSTQDKISTPNIKRSDVIKNSDLIPGDCVITDQYECRVKGRLTNTRGCEDPEKCIMKELSLWTMQHLRSIFITNSP